MTIASTHHTSSHPDDDLLNAWLDGETTDSEAAVILEHLASCARCRQELESLRATKRLLAGLPEARPPRNFTLPTDTGSSGGVIRLLPMSRILGIAAVIAFLVLGVANAFGPVTRVLDTTDDAAPTTTMRSAIGTNPEAETSEESESGFILAAVPADAAERAAPEDSDLMEPVSRLATAEPASERPTLQTVWIISGVIAMVTVVAWAGLSLLESPSRHRGT